MRLTLRIAVICAAFPACAAELPPLTCGGVHPSWEVTLDGESATMTFGHSVPLSVPHRATAEGRDWPMALTLVGAAETAILIVDARSCGPAPFAATLLTQRGSTPLMLVGCCTETP